jgi:Uma2 family endonuclease
MTAIEASPAVVDDIPEHWQLPDHTQLPDRDGTFVHNFQEHPQSILLTDSIQPVLRQLHPDGQYCIGQDCGIYWRLTDPPLLGAVAPDWFYVPHVPPALEGRIRRSYVMWYEGVAPLIALEFVSGDGSEERDRTPRKGKFWIYEQALRIPYYGIYEVDPGRVEVYRLVDGHYEPKAANARGHYEIATLGVELGIWPGRFHNVELPWLRWWDAQGNLLLIGEERAEQERQRAEQERQRAETAESLLQQERQRAETAEQRAQRLAERLRALGVEPEGP